MRLWSQLAVRIDESIRRCSTPRAIGIVAVVAGVMFLIVGAVRLWHRGAGRGVVLVDVLWRVVWIGYSLVLIALVGLIAIAIYNHAGRQRK